MDILYHTEAKRLGFHITSTVQESAHKSWTIITARIRAQDAYCRDLSLDKRIKHVHDYLMARVWYLAQIYPPPDECVRQLNTTISWYTRGEGKSSAYPCPPCKEEKLKEDWTLYI